MIVLLAALAAPAHAGVQALVGVNSAFDGDPASLSVTGRYESTRSPGPVAASFLLPVHVSTRGEERFGVSSNHTRIDIPPSLRLRIVPESPVRAYGDLGAGVAIATSRVDGWLVEDSDTATAFLTRAALGIEVGPAAGPALAIEPLSVHTTYGGSGTRTSLGLMLGISLGT